MFSFTVLENFSRKLHTQKNGPSDAPGPASAGDPLRFFNIHSVAKNEKIEENKNFLFSVKNLTMPNKTERGGPFGIFQHPFCRKTSKKCRGDPLGKNFSKKSLGVPKKFKGGTLWSRPVWYVTRQNRKNLFGSVR